MFIFRNIRFILDYFVESVSSERHISMACSCITFTLHETSKPPAWVSGVSPALFDIVDERGLLLRLFVSVRALHALN